MTEPDLRPRKPPRQRRAQVTVEIILEAATRILARSGLAALTTNRVAEVAGISIGSFYQYFPNKQALVAALITRSQHDLADAVEALVAAEAPADSTLAALSALVVGRQFDQPLLAAALDDAEQTLAIAPVLAAAEQRIRAALAVLAARLGHADPEAAARDIFIIAKALVEAGPASAAGAPPELAQRLQRAITGYLAGP